MILLIFWRNFKFNLYLFFYKILINRFIISKKDYYREFLIKNKII